MRTAVWVLDPELSIQRVDQILADLGERGLKARVQDVPAGKVLVVDEPPADITPPDGVLRGTSFSLPPEQELTRRAFLDNFAVVLAAVTLGSAAAVSTAFAIPPPSRAAGESEVDLGPLADLVAKGVRTFRFGHEPCIAVHSGGKVHALSLVCTHLGCLVEWSAERRQLVCPCHRAAFDLGGNVLQGPPPRPLTSFSVSIRDGNVFVRRWG